MPNDMPAREGEPRSLARYIDHTLLQPTATASDIARLCAEAREHGFYSVCVNGCWVVTAAELLAGTDVKVAAVVGFPLGAMASAAKAAEAQMAVAAGAAEIDMVLNVGLLKGGSDDAVTADVAAVVDAAVATDPAAIVKVIIETGLLTDEEKVRACRLAVAGGAHFVKTSTGFGPGGATVEDVRLMRETVGAGIGVKASGGVRTADAAWAMIAAGATRLGTSSGVKLVQGESGAGAAEPPPAGDY